MGDNKVSFPSWKRAEKSAQVAWEVDVKAFVNREMVTKQLQGYNIEQALEAVDGLRHADRLDILGDSLVTFVAYHDGLCLAGSNLGEGGLDLGVKRVTCHDDNHGHVLIDKCERTMFQLPGEDT